MADRDCNKCVYSTRDGNCRKWSCEGTKTVEDIKAETIDELSKEIEYCLHCGMGKDKSLEHLLKVAEKLKEQKK